MHIHTEDCRWKVYPSGKQECTTARNERARERKVAGEFKSSGNPDRYRRQKPDGWEDEFGPVPLKVAQRDWYDEVVVIRALTKQRTGRYPTAPEWADIIRRMPRAEVVDADVARSTGVSSEYVSRLRSLA